MGKNQTKVKFELHNIGPHENLVFESQKKIDYSIFATNGQGKTFISRCFAALQNDNYPYVGNLTSFGHQLSSFSIDINGIDSHFEIDNGVMRKSKKIDRIFYVFNSDYVNDNVQKKGYKPDNTISGIILGKNQIDLTKEKGELKELELEIVKIRASIVDELEKARDSLISLKISKLMKEFKDITFNNLVGMERIKQHDYDNALDRVKTLSRMPDDLPDVQRLQRIVDSIDYDELDSLLFEKVTPSNLEKEFIDYIKSNNDFIEQGLVILQESKGICPYCKRPLDDESYKIVHQYTEFLEDKEALITKKLNTYKARFDQCLSNIVTIENQVDACKKDVDHIKSYISDIDELSVTILDNPLAEMKLLIEKAKSAIDEKLKQLSSLSIDFKQNGCRDAIKSFNKNIDLLNAEIDKINRNKNRAETILKNNKKELCVQAMKKIRLELDPILNSYNDYVEKIDLKKQEISVKELTNNLDKKELITNAFSKLIDMFFHGKYKFDKNTFEIRLRKTHEIHDGRFTLSDGEKSVIAFAYYISNVFDIVETEEDYGKIVFIIDDPISSMDFSYVYETATVIRNLKDILKISFDKKIILTHNFEFFNILKRNNVSNGFYILSGGSIDPMTQEMLLPYECHLEDVYNVATKKQKPTHTTPNSIRHIIETVCSFENNEKGSRILESFIKEKDEFKNNDYIYTLMQDLSHGTYRISEPYMEVELVTACEKVIEFIDNNYPGQLKSLKNSV